jgi:hypothetical protein
MNGLSTFYILLETIAALAVFVAGYLAAILALIVCCVIADFIYESACFVRAVKTRPHSTHSIGDRLSGSTPTR